MYRVVGIVGVMLLTAGVLSGLTRDSQAQRYTSPNYTIDASVGNSFGGDSGGGSYQLTASGGESIIGNGAGGSYLLDHGYVAQLASSLELTVDQDTINFSGTITPGVSRSADVVASVRTDAPGYNIAINQDNDLTNGGHTISAISGTIASPLTWDEGNTKGLGVTLTAASATAPAGKWNSGTSYAALPGTATAIYSRSGFTGGAVDTLSLRYRIDVVADQAAGDYTNTATYTGTMLP